MKWPLHALIGAVLFLTGGLHAQVKIGDNPQLLSPLSLLELESTDRVFVLNRMTTQQMNALQPLRGAVVYNINESCLFAFDGGSWQSLCEDNRLTVEDNGDGTLTLTDTDGQTYSVSSSPVTNVSLEYVGSELILTDSEGGTVQATIDLNTLLDLTSDAIVNERPTMVITPNGGTLNLEVLEITGEQIADNTINGFTDIQAASITAEELANNSVDSPEIATDAVGDEEIDYTVVTLQDFTNDVGFITDASVVSSAPNNALIFNPAPNPGAFYDDSNLRSRISAVEVDLTTLIPDVATNMQDIGDHLDEDMDISETNEIQTLGLDGNQLSLSSGGGSVDIDADPLNEVNLEFAVEGPELVLRDAGGELSVSLDELGSDDQNVTLNYTPGTQDLEVGIENGTGQTVNLSSLNQSVLANQNQADIDQLQDDLNALTAADVGVADGNGNFVSDTVEGALEELADANAADGDTNPTNELQDAIDVPITDVDNNFTSENVQGALEELFLKAQINADQLVTLDNSLTLTETDVINNTNNININSGRIDLNVTEIGVNATGITDNANGISDNNILITDHINNDLDTDPINEIQTADEVLLSGTATFVSDNVEGALGELSNGLTRKEIRTDNAATVVIGDLDYTVILNDPATTFVTMPDPSLSDGRIIIIKNIAGAPITTSLSYNDSGGGSISIIGSPETVWLQSDGLVWHQIN